MMKHEWSEKELLILQRYFTRGETELTIFTKLIALNPDLTFDAVGHKIRRMKQHGWIRGKDKAIKKLRVGYLDIETTNLNADFGIMLCWVIKGSESKVLQHGLIERRDVEDGLYDYFIVHELLVAMKQYDVIYTHYGSDRRFDVPFIRTRAYAHRMEGMLPDYMDQFLLDTYPMAKNKFKLHSYRLDSIADALGVKGCRKTHLVPSIWMRAMFMQDPGALKYILKHCEQDVLLLEGVVKKMKKVERPKYVSV